MTDVAIFRCKKCIHKDNVRCNFCNIVVYYVKIRITEVCVMYRIAMEKLLKWKQSKRRKPLIIEGARQVGKTWLMKEFGKQAYADTVYINFDSNSRMAELFASDLDTKRLIMGIELYVGRKINSENCLLIFDEVQEVIVHFTAFNAVKKL